MAITALVTTDTLSTWFTTINAIITDVNATLPINVIDADSDTKIQVEESADEDIIRFDAAGTELAAWSLTDIVMNETGVDVNFRVESNDNTYMFYIDATKNSIVIGAGSDISSADTPFLINFAARTATASTNFARVKVHNTNAITIPSGTTPIVASLHIEEPNITATGTVTSAASLYIAGAPTEATNDYALWVDGGTTRLDGDLIFDTASSNQITFKGGQKFGDNPSATHQLIFQLGNSTSGGRWQFNLGASNLNAFHMTQTGNGIGETVFNDDSIDRDFRVETNNMANAFHIDGGNDHIGVGVLGRDRTGFTISPNDWTVPVSAYGSIFYVGEVAMTGAVGQDMVVIAMGSNTLVEAGSGAHTLAAGAAFYAPGLTTSGGATTTNATTVYISGGMTGATNNYALWVDAGDVRFDGNLAVTGTVTATGNTTASGTLTVSGSTVTMTTPTVALGTFTTSNTSVVANLNATKWDGAAKTVSTSAPSGGSAGDVWFRYVA